MNGVTPFPATAGGVFYSFVGTGDLVTASLCGSANTAFDSELFVYQGTCTASTGVTANDDGCNGGTSPLSTVSFFSTLGTNYILFVSGFSSGINRSAFSLAITCAALPNLVVSTPQAVAGNYNNVTVTSGGVATLSGDLTFGGTLTVQNGGSLAGDLASYIQGPGQVVVQAGATFIEPNAAGLTNSGLGSFLLSSPNPISLSPDANYVFNGTAAQVTGVLAPAGMRSLTVNNAAGLTLSAATAVAQTLTLTSGSLASGGLLTLVSNASGTALVANIGSGTVTGAAAVQRYINPAVNSGLGYRHYSSPVASQPFGGLAVGSFAPVLNTAYNTSATPYTITPFPNVFGYDEARLTTVSNDIPDAFSKGWVVPTTAALAVGRGYTANLAAANTVTFNGTLNNGDQPVALARSGGAAGGWQLVGNPYPAPLDLGSIAPADRPGLDAAFYVFRSTSQYNGIYDTQVNGVGSFPVASGQGFFCRVSAGQTTGSLTFRNAQRLTSFSATGPVFQRGAPETRPLLRLTLAPATPGALADPLYVYLQAGASAGFDPEFDAAKLPNSTGLNLAALAAGGEPVAISGLPLPTAATLVPLALGLPAAGSYVLTAAELARFGGTTVVLRDALTGTRTVLAPGTAYPFVAATTRADGRFTLELNPAAAPLATAAQALAALVQVYPNPAPGAFRLVLPASAKAATAQLVNALGQVVSARTLTGTEAAFSTAGLAPGIYTLRLVVDGTALARKLTVE